MWSYEQLVEESERLDNRLQRAARVSTLPRDVDYDWVDGLAFEMTQAPA